MASGYAVSITQGITTYLPGINFQTDFGHGHILWIDGAPQPVPGSAYQVTYTYFPKQILEKLLGLVQPATIKILMQFTTSDSRIFNPYFFEGQINPSGDVILPKV